MITKSNFQNQISKSKSNFVVITKSNFVMITKSNFVMITKSKCFPVKFAATEFAPPDFIPLIEVFTVYETIRAEWCRGPKFPQSLRIVP